MQNIEEEEKLKEMLQLEKAKKDQELSKHLEEELENLAEEIESRGRPYDEVDPGGNASVSSKMKESQE